MALSRYTYSPARCVSKNNILLLLKFIGLYEKKHLVVISSTATIQR